LVFILATILTVTVYRCISLLVGQPRTDGATCKTKDIAMTTKIVEWKPAFELNLDMAGSAAFFTIVDKFHAWAKQQPEADHGLQNGWHVITPELAEQLLSRNPEGANRRPIMAQVVYYAQQMVANDWQPTGQGLIISTAGELLDGQHRLWACYFSGASFRTFVLTDVEAKPNLFAYMDNVKARSASDALQTAGMNGVSATIAQAVKIANEMDHGAYVTGGKKIRVMRMPKMSPIQVIRYAEEHPVLHRACRLVAGEYQSAALVIGHKDVTAYAAAQIIELHDEYVLGEFMEDLGAIREDFPAGSPIAAFHAVMATNLKAVQQMSKMEILAHLIKAFNAFVEGREVKKLTFRVNEDFPTFVAKTEAEATEAAE
jgi:hypothetical protein